MKKLGIVATTLLAAGCGSAPSDPPQVIKGMPNPASAYCVKLGGTLSIEETKDGQIGICHLPDGTRIEEWALFRRDHPQGAR